MTLHASHVSYDPVVRAPLTRSIVLLLERREPEIASKLRTRLSPLFERVERASPMDWIPLVLQLELLDAMLEEMGAERWESFVTAHFAATVEQPFLKDVFETAVRLLGVGPATVFRVFGRTWMNITRNCGEFYVSEINQNGTVLHMQRLPDIPRIDTFVYGFRFTMQGVIEAFGRRGLVEQRSYNRLTRSVSYMARWV